MKMLVIFIPRNHKAREPIHRKLCGNLGILRHCRSFIGFGCGCGGQGGNGGLHRHGTLRLVSRIGHRHNVGHLAGLVLLQVLHFQCGGVGVSGQQGGGQREADADRLPRLDLVALGILEGNVQRHKAIVVHLGFVQLGSHIGHGLGVIGARTDQGRGQGRILGQAARRDVHLHGGVGALDLRLGRAGRVGGRVSGRTFFLRSFRGSHFTYRPGCGSGFICRFRRGLTVCCQCGADQTTGHTEHQQCTEYTFFHVRSTPHLYRLCVCVGLRLLSCVQPDTCGRYCGASLGGHRRGFISAVQPLQAARRCFFLIQPGVAGNALDAQAYIFAVCRSVASRQKNRPALDAPLSDVLIQAVLQFP